MPQMAPMWWTILFMIFITSYVMFMMNVYFFVIYENKKTLKEVKKTGNFNWKW